jgi:hypothetical protein
MVKRMVDTQALSISNNPAPLTEKSAEIKHRRIPYGSSETCGRRGGKRGFIAASTHTLQQQCPCIEPAGEYCRSYLHHMHMEKHTHYHTYPHTCTRRLPPHLTCVHAVRFACLSSRNKSTKNKSGKLFCCSSSHLLLLPTHPRRYHEHLTQAFYQVHGKNSTTVCVWMYSSSCD